MLKLQVFINNLYLGTQFCVVTNKIKKRSRDKDFIFDFVAQWEDKLAYPSKKYITYVNTYVISFGHSPTDSRVGTWLYICSQNEAKHTIARFTVPPSGFIPFTPIKFRCRAIEITFSILLHTANQIGKRRINLLHVSVPPRFRSNNKN